MKTFISIFGLISFLQISSFAQSVAPYKMEKKEDTHKTTQFTLSSDSVLVFKNWTDKSPVNFKNNGFPSANELEKLENNSAYSLIIIKPDIAQYPHLEWSIDTTIKYHILQVDPLKKSEK